MSFADALKRLRAAAWLNGLRPSAKVSVSVGDLRELIEDFDRIDGLLRERAESSVRDEFAMAALKAMGQPKGSQSVEDVARWAYQMADAMMQERAR